MNRRKQVRRPPTPRDPWQALMRLLRYRPRSLAEVKRRLLSLGFAHEEIDKVVATAQAAGLLDDDAFARVWVQDRLLHHPLSRRAVRQELVDKGIDKQTIDTAVDKLYPAEEEKKIALELAQTRMAQYATLDRHRAIQRTISFLGRRGFSFSLANSVVRNVVRGSND